MNLQAIPCGSNPPYVVNVIVEVPFGTEPVKYELDKASGALRVDRFLHTAMFYPGNYGFIPHTLAADGDPTDVIVLADVPVVPGALIEVRPIGVLMMADEGGPDEKIVAVPVDRVHPGYGHVQTCKDLPALMCDRISHFFQHYKDLEQGKWVSQVMSWAPPETAFDIIRRAMTAAAG